MGTNISRPKQQPNVPIPRYFPQGPTMPPMSGYPPMPGSSPFNISRPNSPMVPGMVDPLTLNRRQQRKLEEAERTIGNLQNQMAMMRQSQMGTPPPMPYGPPPMPYGNSPTMGRHSYPPPSPLLQRYGGQYQQPYPQQMPIMPGGYRDSDFAAVANIAGLNPVDIALLHREYTNLTRGGTNKIDRVVFRQLLREAMVEANNENIDRAIENIFVSIDRNHDGFIDFPEFVGAFRDILRGVPPDLQNFTGQQALPDLLNDQHRGSSFNSNICYPSQSSGQIISIPPSNVCYPSQSSGQVITIPSSSNICYPSQSSGQVYSIPSSNAQQSPLVYGGASPLVISLDGNQGQSSALQCVPLPIY